MELSWEVVAFLIFSVVSLGSGLMVVLTRNLFHAVLFLMATLFGVAGLFILLVAPFLAAVQVLVYIGAIAILMLFVIMLTRQMMANPEVYNAQWQWSALTSVVLFGVLLLVLTPLGDELGGDLAKFSATLPEDPTAEVEYVTVQELGTALVTRDGFVLPFEVTSILLTAAMIGAIVVAREDEA
jgi:NADH-quinone oxidoreductase subunit J